MKRFIALILALSLFLSLAACGNNAEAESESSALPISSESDSSEASFIEVDENLFNVEFTLPAGYVDEGVTQESLNAEMDADVFKSATLNPDGSVTYVMTKSQHKAMIKEVQDTIDESLTELVGSTDYPNIVDIEVNADYTDYKVALSTEEVGLQEAFTPLIFYVYGGLYNVIAGNEVDNISVSFISQATGEVIDTVNSKDMQE